MNTNNIINEIDNRFSETYKSATSFINSGDLWDFCMETIKNPITMSNITFANDLGIPPVRSLVLIYERKYNPSKDFKFTAYESQSMGALMGFVFKYVLDYKTQKERCTVKQYGIGTATRYLDGTPVDFE